MRAGRTVPAKRLGGSRSLPYAASVSPAFRRRKIGVTRWRIAPGLVNQLRSVVLDQPYEAGGELAATVVKRGGGEGAQRGGGGGGRAQVAVPRPGPGTAATRAPCAERGEAQSSRAPPGSLRRVD